MSAIEKCDYDLNNKIIQSSASSLDVKALAISARGLELLKKNKVGQIDNLTSIVQNTQVVNPAMQNMPIASETPVSSPNINVPSQNIPPIVNNPINNDLLGSLGISSTPQTPVINPNVPTQINTAPIESSIPQQPVVQSNMFENTIKQDPQVKGQDVLTSFANEKINLPFENISIDNIKSEKESSPLVVQTPIANVTKENTIMQDVVPNENIVDNKVGDVKQSEVQQNTLSEHDKLLIDELKKYFDNLVKVEVASLMNEFVNKMSEENAKTMNEFATKMNNKPVSMVKEEKEVPLVNPLAGVSTPNYDTQFNNIMGSINSSFSNIDGLSKPTI